MRIAGVEGWRLRHAVIVDHFLGLEQATDIGLTVQDLAPGSDVEFGAIEQEQLVAPELQ